jgi:small subunit ribosomal protein S8e
MVDTSSPHLFVQYAQPVSKKSAKAAASAAETATEEKKALSHHAQRNLDARKKEAKIDSLLDTQFAAGRLYASISSRPGQSGRADGYILEGKELEVRGATYFLE